MKSCAAGEAASRGDRGMRAYFARRAQAAAVVAGALSLAALLELQNSNAALFDRLTGRALPLVVVAGVCGLAVFGLLAIGRPTGVRVIAALGVAAVVWGWGVAQYPVLLPGTPVTLSNAGAPPTTMTAVIVVFIAAAVLLAPSFALLYMLQGRRLLGGGEYGTLPAAAPAGYPGQPPADSARRQPPQDRHPLSGVRVVALGAAAITALVRRLRQH